MNTALLKSAALTAAWMTLSPWAGAQTAPAAGEKIYQQLCIACHATGVANAPKVGDRQAWKPLIAEGQVTLTAHGWAGVRAMPAQGGDPKLGIEDFARALAWMVRSSGGTWNDPDPETLKAIRKEARERVQKQSAARRKLLEEPAR
ncbi:MAG: c-type cytochrome [Limnohabitans sp.]